MKTAREMEDVRVLDSSADNRNLSEALTKIKGIAARLQLGASRAVKK